MDDNRVRITTFNSNCCCFPNALDAWTILLATSSSGQKRSFASTFRSKTAPVTNRLGSVLELFKASCLEKCFWLERPFADGRAAPERCRSHRDPSIVTAGHSFIQTGQRSIGVGGSALMFPRGHAHLCPHNLENQMSWWWTSNRLD